MKIGTVCYATDQGLGMLAKQFHTAGLIDQVMIFCHPRGRLTHTEWYPEAHILTGRPFQGPAVERFLSNVDVVIFWETPFDWSLPNRCRAKGVKTAIVVMHEWFPLQPQAQFDLYLCPSLLDLDYFQRDGHARGKPCVFLPIPAAGNWRQRTVAQRFLHNAGWIGSRNHKGTEELLKAIPLVKSPMELTIATQAPVASFMSMVSDQVRDDKRVTFRFGTRPYEELFDSFHAYVAPEKFNGLSLPLQEAHAAGLLVITTDRYPANTWLPKEPLIPVAGYQKARVAPGYLEVDEAIVEPVVIAETIDRFYDTNISEHSLAGRHWAEENSWAVLGPQYRKVLEGIR